MLFWAPMTFIIWTKNIWNITFTKVIQIGKTKNIFCENHPFKSVTLLLDLMVCYLTYIAYKMWIIPLMTGFALTCPRAHNVSAGRLWHCICQPLLQALFCGFYRGHVTQSETLRPAATHLQQGDAAVKHACREKNREKNNSSNHDFDSQCIIAHYEYILSLQTEFFSVLYLLCLSNFMMMIIPKITPYWLENVSLL